MNTVDGSSTLQTLGASSFAVAALLLGACSSSDSASAALSTADASVGIDATPTSDGAAGAANPDSTSPTTPDGGPSDSATPSPATPDGSGDGGTCDPGGCYSHLPSGCRGVPYDSCGTVNGLCTCIVSCMNLPDGGTNCGQPCKYTDEGRAYCNAVTTP